MSLGFNIIDSKVRDVFSLLSEEVNAIPENDNVVCFIPTLSSFSNSDYISLNDKNGLFFENEKDFNYFNNVKLFGNPFLIKKMINSNNVLSTYKNIKDLSSNPKVNQNLRLCIGLNAKEMNKYLEFFNKTLVDFFKNYHDSSSEKKEEMITNYIYEMINNGLLSEKEFNDNKNNIPLKNMVEAIFSIYCKNDMGVIKKNKFVLFNKVDKSNFLIDEDNEHLLNYFYDQTIKVLVKNKEIKIIPEIVLNNHYNNENINFVKQIFQLSKKNISPKRFNSFWKDLVVAYISGGTYVDKKLEDVFSAKDDVVLRKEMLDEFLKDLDKKSNITSKNWFSYLQKFLINNLSKNELELRKESLEKIMPLLFVEKNISLNNMNEQVFVKHVFDFNLLDVCTEIVLNKAVDDFSQDLESFLENSFKIMYDNDSKSNKSKIKILLDNCNNLFIYIDCESPFTLDKEFFKYILEDFIVNYKEKTNLFEKYFINIEDFANESVIKYKEILLKQKFYLQNKTNEKESIKLTRKKV